jgi:glycerophosphoryl diester phosphodiesterase
MKIQFLISILFCLIISFADAQDTIFKTPVITSHRGAASFAPENTIASVQKALDMGVTRIEIDIRQTKDSVLVLLHDKKLKRTTGQKGKLKNLKFSETIGLNASSGFKSVYTSQQIPTLSEVLKLVNGKSKLVLDLKVSGKSIEKKLIKLIDSCHAQSWCIIASMKDRPLKRIHKLEPLIELHKSFVGKIPFMPVYIAIGLFTRSLKKYDYVSEFNFKYNFISKHLVNKIHKLNKKINAWTVDKQSKFIKVVSKNVDGVITDNPNISKE